MLILFGLSALIKFAIKLFEMLVKLALLLIILFFAFKAIGFGDAPTNTKKQPAPIIDTVPLDSLNTILLNPSQSKP